MRKVDDREEKRKKGKKKEKNGVFSGHYVIASSLPPERLRPNDDRWNAARSCQLYSVQFMTKLCKTNLLLLFYVVHYRPESFVVC